ncbi:MAG TPA: hemolysin family protein, partial [Planctomycetota bacterium]|nr:hemolysin family protein [Planctomycetota bacterium]
MVDGILQDLGLIVLTIGLVLLNGFFVAAEFAIVKVRGTRLAELAEDDWRARIARTIVGHLDAYLAATQVGITFASLALGWVGEPSVARMLEPLLGALGVHSARAVHGIATPIAFAAISFMHIVIGEQAPKAAAIASADRTALWIALPLRAFYLLAFPAIWLTNAASNLMLRIVGLRRASEADLAYSPDELEMIVETSARAGLLNDQERKLLENAIHLSDQRVREIMIPRPDMVCLDSTKPLERNLAIVREQQHTRYPLLAEDGDRVIGFIHVKDLMQALARTGPEAREDGERVSLQKIARPVIFVPEAAPIDRLLRQFQRSRTHLAIVVDEYGSLAGLVTLEDVLEELVGPIRDEFDADERDLPIDARSGESVIDAGTPLAQVAETFKFEPAQATVDTIGGYVLQLLGRMPKVGETVAIGRWRVEVAEMEGLRLTRLRFKPRDERVAQRVA